MDQQQYNKLFSFIWSIANDELVHVFKKSDYRDIIMPMLVLRRLDIMLEPTHKQVLEQKKMLEQRGISNMAPILMNTTGLPFYNTSNFTMKLLTAETDPQRLKSNVNDYLDGFSDDVQDIIMKLKLKQAVDDLTLNLRLGGVLEKFTSDSINLGVNPVLNEDGSVKLPGLDNHTMGTLYEDLLRKFNEENSVTEAGEHFTPRDYVKLLADLAVMPVIDKLTDNTYTIYDGACGTGGILTITEERLQEIALEKGKNIATMIFGQESEPSTLATCKADLLMSGTHKLLTYNAGSTQRHVIGFGSTISKDQHPGTTFDFCVSNPPFGTSWKEDINAMGHADKKEISDKRFVIAYDGEEEYRMLPDTGDPQLLFLANNISRMKDTPLGTRIVEIHNGSSIFTGNAGQGESNLRRYIIENDLLETIINMPENMFYNTGIETFVWILSNRKSTDRKGKVQLIYAKDISTPLRKNLGEKNCEVTEAQRKEILDLYLNNAENEKCRIFQGDEFEYWSVTVNRPLRLVYEFTQQRLDVALNGLNGVKKKDEEFIIFFTKYVNERLGTTVMSSAKANADFLKAMTDAKLKETKGRTAILDKCFSYICPDAEPVLDANGNPLPDKNLASTELVPMRYKLEGQAEANNRTSQEVITLFFNNEVKPYVPDAFVDFDSVKIGCEISFTKYFYRPVELRPLADIEADLRKSEDELNGLLGQIFND